MKTAATICALLLAFAGLSDDLARADALFDTAMGQYRMERWEDAAKKFYDFMAAAPTDPRNDQAQFYVGICYQNRKFMNQAIEEFGYVIGDFPNSPYALLARSHRAACYEAIRQPELATADRLVVTQTKLELTPGHHKSFERTLWDTHRHNIFTLAKQYRQEGKHDLAIQVYQRLPNPLEAFRYVTDVYYELKNYDQIRDMVDTLQGQNRHHGFKYLVEFYSKQNAVNQLKNIYSKLLDEKNPTNATDDLVWHTGHSFRNLEGDYWVWAMEQMSARYPRLARRAEHHLCRHNHRNPKYIDSMQLFVVKYEKGRDVDEVLRWMGLCYEISGRPEEARQAYRQISDAGLGNWYACETYHGHYAKKRDYAGAVKAYEEMRQAFHSQVWSAKAQLRIAEIQRRNLRQTEAAIESYRQLVNRFATVREHNRLYGPIGQLALADTLREAKRHEEAIAEYQTVKTRWRKSDEAAWAAYRIALAYEGLGDRQQAIANMKSCLRMYPKTQAASEAHTRLETVYKVADTSVTDETEIFVP